MLESLKVAIAHDVLINRGGAERVAAVFSEMFPKAPIFTGAFHPEKTYRLFRDRDVRTTFLGALPHNERLVKFAFPAAIPAVESFDTGGYDLLLSSSTFLVKGIVAKPGTLHVAYLHNVFRLLWLKGSYGEGEKRRRKILDGLLMPLRLWDQEASKRPDVILTNSLVVRKRLRKYYRRDAQVMHPPVDLSAFEISPFQDDYFLLVSRLESYKRVDVAIRAFNDLGLRLVIVGDGSLGSELRALAGPTIEFLGVVTDDLLRELYPRARALIFPGEEDFGLVPIEAQASGRPVIAYGAGGALETVTPETGIFFSPQTPEALVAAVRRFEECEFNAETIRAHAMKYDKQHFMANMRRYLTSCLSLHATGDLLSAIPGPTA